MAKPLDGFRVSPLAPKLSLETRARLEFAKAALQGLTAGVSASTLSRPNSVWSESIQREVVKASWDLAETMWREMPKDIREEFEDAQQE